MLLDDHQRIVGALAGQPHNQKDWAHVTSQAVRKLEPIGKKLIKREAKRKNKHFCQRHGKFLSVPHGISFGGGQEVRAALF